MEIITLLLTIILLSETTYLVAVNTKRLPNIDSRLRVFVDTSVLIDGRIVSVAKSGFFMGKLIIPRSVIGELQFLADHSDTERRMRARHGLDVVSELQSIVGLDIEILQDGSTAQEGVDERLLNLAKKYNGAICTIDYNLNKVAQVEGILVLNVNDLAMNLRMSYLPGEVTVIELKQKGQDPNQAVGYLADSTMVVVERANRLVGKTVEVEFIRSLQTAAGKMMFAKLVDRKASQNTAKKVADAKQTSATPKPAAVKKAQPKTAKKVNSNTSYRPKNSNRSKKATN